MPPEGSSEITTSIGGRCKVREGFSRPVLISREAWPVLISKCTDGCLRLVSIVIQVGVAMAEGSHLFPFRTEKLSPPAPMVLPGKPGGRVGCRPLCFTRPGVLATPGRSCFQAVAAGRGCAYVPGRRRTTRSRPDLWAPIRSLHATRPSACGANNYRQ